MQVGSVTFHAAVTDAVGTILHQVSEEPPKYLVRLLFSFRGVDEVEVPETRIVAKWELLMLTRRPMISVLHTWGTILSAAGGVLGVLLAVPAFKFDGFWKTSLRIATFVLMLGLSMLLEEQVLSSAGVS
jgi:hypothetical protein